MSALVLKDLRAFIQKHKTFSKRKNDPKIYHSPIFKALQIYLEELFILNELDIEDKIFDEHFLVSEMIWFSKIHELVSKNLFDNYPNLNKKSVQFEKKEMSSKRKVSKKICSVAEEIQLTSRLDSRFNSLTLLNLGEIEKKNMKILLQNKRIFCEELNKLIRIVFSKKDKDKIANYTSKMEFVDLCLIVNQESRKGTLKRRIREFRSEIMSFLSQLAEKIGSNNHLLKKIFR
jgi:hypothetical protein